MALKNFDVGVSLRRELELIKEARCVWVLRGFTQGEKTSLKHQFLHARLFLRGYSLGMLSYLTICRVNNMSNINK